MITPRLNAMERDALRQIFRGRARCGDVPISLSLWYERTATELQKRGLLVVNDDPKLPTGLLWCTLTSTGADAAAPLCEGEVPS